MTKTDENIMVEVASGDIRKASILFDRYHTNVFNYLMKVNQNRMLAEDLTQNVFEKVIKYRSSYEGKKSFKAWLFTIVRNTNIDHHRKRKYQSLDNSFMQVKDTNADVHKDLERKENNSQLMAAINMLPAEEKELLILTKFEHMKYSEVSKMMGMAESTLKVKAHRTIKKLRSILINEMKYEY